LVIVCVMSRQIHGKRFLVESNYFWPWIFQVLRGVRLLIATGLGGEMSRTKVMLFDTHTLFRQCLRNMLMMEDFDVVEELDDINMLVERVIAVRPDLLLMDVSEARLRYTSIIESISSKAPEVRIVVLAEDKDILLVFDALRVGARGYITKEVDYARFICVLRRVIHGEITFTPDLARKLVSELTTRYSSKNEPFALLTSREREILSLLVHGVSSTRDLAEKLGVTEHTVKFHFRNILSKLHLKNRAQVAAYAARYNAVAETDNEFVGFVS